MCDWASLEKFVCWEAVILLSGFILAVAHRSLTRRINLRGLFIVKDDGGANSPTRVQLLFFTVAYAIYYLMQVINNPKEFPAISHEVLYALGASHSVYLVAKGRALDKLVPDNNPTDWPL